MNYVGLYLAFIFSCLLHLIISLSRIDSLCIVALLLLLLLLLPVLLSLWGREEERAFQLFSLSQPHVARSVLLGACLLGSPTHTWSCC